MCLLHGTGVNAIMDINGSMYRKIRCRTLHHHRNLIYSEEWAGIPSLFGGLLGLRSLRLGDPLNGHLPLGIRLLWFLINVFLVDPVSASI